MANLVENFSSSDRKFIKSAEKFETEVKNKLTWNRKQWAESGESGTRINKLVNSLHYWKDKLKPAYVDKSIVFTLFNEEHDEKTDLLTIIREIEELDTEIKVRGFSDFRNPRYLCIYFDSKEERDFITEKFRMIKNSYVVMLAWALEKVNNVLSMKVHWLPRAFDLEEIKAALDKYVNYIEEERVALSLMDGRDMPSGKVNFRVKVNQGHTAESIPHLIMVAGMEALVTVAGRQPLCLNCEALGHISKKCKLRYCSSCKQLKERQHTCAQPNGKSSYAQALKGSEDSNIGRDPDDWGSEIIIRGEKKTNSENISDSQKDEISMKIADLQQKISISAPNISSVTSVQLVSKRQAEVASNIMQAESSRWADQIEAISSEVDSEEDKEGSNHSIMEEQDEEDLADDTHMEEDGKALVRDNKKCVVGLEKKKSSAISKNKKNKLNQGNSITNKEKIVEKVVVSYGKPVYNTRKQKAQEKFDRLVEKREFVFTDGPDS